MISEKLHANVRQAVSWMQRFADRFWYTPLIGLLAALDNLIIVIPNDGILISSSMLIPKRWFIFAVSVAVGSTLGAVGLAIIVESQELPWVLKVYPGISDTTTWSWSMDFFDKYGLLLVFAVAIAPIVQQPVVILASLANTPLAELAAVIFAGRFIKFLIMAYIGSHAPRLLKKVWGLKGELDEVGIRLK